MLGILVSLVMNVLTLLMGFLPNIDPSIVGSISNISTQLKTSLSSINFFFPVPDLFYVFSSIITLYIIKYSVKLVRFILNFVPMVKAN